MAAVEPDEGGEVLLLLGEKIANFAGDLPVDVSGVDYQHLIPAPL